MAEKKLSVLAVIKAKPGLEKKVKEEIMALVGPTRKEPGCINYDLHQDLEDEGHLILYENWTSKEALDEHLAMPYLQALIEKQDELLSEPVKITLMDMISPEAK